MKLTLPLIYVVVLTLGHCPHALAAFTDVAAEARKIDALLAADWQKHQLQGNPVADDATFLRRIHLDVVGRIPTAREAEDFLSSQDAEKRAKVIDRLLSSEGYVQHFYNYWSDVLRVQSKGTMIKATTADAYMSWVKDVLRKNMPYDQMVRALLGAQGKAWDNGAIGYYMRDVGMPLDNMAITSRIFLGTRIECAQCHDHPFDKWSQKQFYEMAAHTFAIKTDDIFGQPGATFGSEAGEADRQFMQGREKAIRDSFSEPARPIRTEGMSDAKFAELERAHATKVTELQAQQEQAMAVLRREKVSHAEVFDSINTMFGVRTTALSMGKNQLTLPHDYQYSDAKPLSVVEAATMMGQPCVARPGETMPQAFARWTATPENPRFTTVIVNRMWKKAFGLGLMEPLDNLSDKSVPMVPELQSHLEKVMVGVGYDLKAFLRIVFNTQAYQRQATASAVASGAEYHFTGPLLRRMSAEQIWDSFVTLINPNPELSTSLARTAHEQGILQPRRRAEALECLTTEELLRGIQAAAEAQSKARDASKELSDRYTAALSKAKSAQDKADLLEDSAHDAAQTVADELKSEAARLGQDLFRISHEASIALYSQVLVPGLKKLYAKTTSKTWQAPAPQAAKTDLPAVLQSTDAQIALDEITRRNGTPPCFRPYYDPATTVRILIPGFDLETMTPEGKKAAQDKEDVIYHDEARALGIPKDEWTNYTVARRQNTREWVRAAELTSPAPRGHYLREFGQSDRDFVENANLRASVPQVLVMMNSALVPKLTEPHSPLMHAVKKLTAADAQVHAIYLALLSRPPTEKERLLWNEASTTGHGSPEDIIYSLVNTRQFIFIQ
ncbi:MAG: DUF1549 domain-containing protein [Verrucomicrobia bacterium]|nr:DUF1549 domain-containing protein [Verrucomicrobiota bacterium]